MKYRQQLVSKFSDTHHAMPNFEDNESPNYCITYMYHKHMITKTVVRNGNLRLTITNNSRCQLSPTPLLAESHANKSYGLWGAIPQPLVALKSQTSLSALRKVSWATPEYIWAALPSVGEFFG